MVKSSYQNIFIKGARVNNLKGIDVEIPRDKLVVITGLSGSGKSSLAFDTLYAEGQRRYVESLSSYARQFMGRMNKPECDYIKGIPPAIAIEQKVNTRNTRSTVGTSTEIYEYLRLLFSRIGKTISPISGQLVKKHQTSDLLDFVKQFPQKTRIAIFAPIHPIEGRTMEMQLKAFLQQGYSRLYINNKIVRIGDALKDASLYERKEIELMIDRSIISDQENDKTRLAESAEAAFFEGHQTCILRIFLEKKTITQPFSKKFELDSISFLEPSDMMFSFNNPLGACPTCEGFGKIIGIDENLVVPDKSLSIYEGAIICWKGETMGKWLSDFIEKSNTYKFPIHRPYYDLSAKQKDLLWHGKKGEVSGIDDFFTFVRSNQYKIQYRVMLSRYRGKTFCPTCKGSRLKPEALYVQVGGKNIAEIVKLPIKEAKIFFDQLKLDETDAAIARRLLIEIKHRLTFLIDVGLEYLTLDRLSASLSGGESQRISLATSLGNSLVGSLYILDEPSIGLHSRDTDNLIRVLKNLCSLGNTVVVVEHDEEIMRAADYIIDIGPDAGSKGGEVVYQGKISEITKGVKSHTVRYLTGEEKIERPTFIRPWNNFIEIKGARKNNLKGFDVKIPLYVMTVVTGVSGSGKSSLVRDIFYEGIKHKLDEAKALGVECKSIEGDFHLIQNIILVDQNSIGKSSRSNPVTYIGAYEYIRKLFAEQPLAKQMNFTPAFFSFNKEGGRCEECKGEGTITVEMQFMADIRLQCETCHGKRFQQDILDVHYHDKNIYDVLNMTINEAINFFEKNKKNERSLETKIITKLLPLRDVGLGYIKMGQSSSSLSGGENQRVKLAYYLGLERQSHTLFVFDEPTTGLHFHDIKTLLNAFNKLIAKGHTIVIVEHNLEVIKCADYVIDLGPEGGDKGGYLVCVGTPEEIAACQKSYTGNYLKDKL